MTLQSESRTAIHGTAGEFVFKGDGSLSVVVPVYWNEGSIGEVLNRLEEINLQMAARLQAVFVLDGPSDGSAQTLIAELPKASFDWKLIELSRNFGAFSAIQVGLTHSDGCFVGVMTADLQEPVTFLLEAFDLLQLGEIDVVVGCRESRADPVGQRAGAWFFWRLYRRLVQPDIPGGGVDVFACSKQVAHVLGGYGEANTSLIGLLFWSGFRRATVTYARPQRDSGKSSWTFRKRFRYMANSVYSFTTLPLMVLQGLGLLGLVVSIAVGTSVLVAYLSGSIEVSGYVPLMLAVTGSTSVLLIGMGILGSYLWRIFDNTKNRPLTIISRIYANGNSTEETQ